MEGNGRGLIEVFFYSAGGMEGNTKKLLSR